MTRISSDIPTYNQLPPAVGGVIYLSEGVYDLNMGTLTTAASIQFPKDLDCMLQNGYLSYTGGGTFFNTADIGTKTKFLSNVTIDLNNSGTAFNIGSTDPTGVILLDKIDLFNCTSLGTFDGVTLTFAIARVRYFDTGFTFNDMSLVDMNRVEMLGNDAGTSYLNFTGTQQAVIISTYSPIMTGTSDYAFDFNTTATYGGVVVNNTIPLLSGGADVTNMFASGSYDQKTIGFKFTNNIYIPDSTISVQLGFQNNATETVIDQVSVPVRINGTYVNGFEERMTHDSSGMVTYNGLETTSISARAFISIEPVVGVNILMGAYIAHTEAETYEVTFTNATNIVNRVGHGLSNGTSIRFSTGGTLPAEIRDDQFYWVVNKTDDTFQVSRTSGGAAYSFTDDGTGTHYYSIGGYVDSSEVTTSASINSSDNIVIETLHEVSTGDKLEVFVDNHDSTSNILVTSINFIVHKV